MRLLARCSLLEHGHNAVSRTVKVIPCARRYDVEQALSGFPSEVRLLDHTLRRVDIRQVESCCGVARIENSGKTHTGGEGLDHYTVHFVVGYVAGLTEVDRVYHFIIAIRLVALKVLCLSAVA